MRQKCYNTVSVNIIEFWKVEVSMYSLLLNTCIQCNLDYANLNHPNIELFDCYIKIYYA